MKQKRIHIYIIYFPTSNRPNSYYIGQTAYLEKRMSKHLISKSLVGNALQKYDDWEIEILHTTKDRDTANLLEIEEIRHYDCVAPNGYNLTRGGEGGDTFTGKHHTEGTKEKLRKIHKGKQYVKGKHWKWSKESKEKASRNHIDVNGENNPVYGKHWNWSEESKRKMQGNKNAKGCKHSKKQLEANKGNQYAKGKNLGENNPMNRPEVKIKRLKTRIANLEKEI